MHRLSAVILSLLALGGCGAPTEEAGKREAVPPPPVASQAAVAAAEPADEAALRRQTATLQAKYDALRIERDRLADRVGTHQADGEKRLAELKQQWKGAAESDRERFAERARNEMESALMMDEEYRAQLREADDELQRIERELHELRRAATR